MTTDAAGAGDGAPEANRIESDLARTRARLDSTIDALQEKLAPGQMVDQAVAYLKETGGGEFGRNMMVTVRDNPVPVALVGIGLAWLMVTNALRGGGAGAADRDRYDAARERYRAAGGAGLYRGGGDVTGVDAAAGLDAGATAGLGASSSAAASAAGPAGEFRRAGRTTAVYPAGTASSAAFGVAGGDDDPGLEGRLAREEGYLTQRGAYASAAAEDLATRANAAGSGVRRDPGEADEAYEGRVYAAKGGVLGLRRSGDEPHAGFRARVEAAIAAAAERYERARGQAARMGGDMASRGRSTMQGVSGYGRSAAEGAYGYGRSAAEGAYGYGQVAARSVLDHPLPYALIGAGIAWLLISGRGSEERRRRPYEAMRYYAGRGPDLGAPSGGAGYASGGGYGGGYAGGDRYAAGYGSAGYGAGAGGRAGTAAYGGTSVYGYDEADVEDLASRAHAAGSAVGRADEEDEDAYQGRVYAARGQELGLAQNVGETLSSFRERVDAALAAAGERYARWRDQAAAAAGRLGAQGQGAAQGLYGYGRGAAGYVQDQPWLMGLLGLGAGALLGLLAAPSRYERELMRGVGDDVRERFRDAAGDAMESASRVAREVMGAAREAAEREGLTDVELPSASGLAHAARGRVQDAASRVRHVVEETAAAGRAAVERELGAAGGTGGNGSGGASAGPGSTAGASGVGSGTSTSTSGGQAGKDAGTSSSSQVGGTSSSASGGGSAASTTGRGA